MKADQLRTSFTSIEVNGTFTEAVVTLTDGSRLCFRHRVDERSVQCQSGGSSAGIAGDLLPAIATFRLNAKHLDIRFADGSTWEAAF
jgi:hypothetical protein